VASGEFPVRNRDRAFSVVKVKAKRDFKRQEERNKRMEEGAQAQGPIPKAGIFLVQLHCKGAKTTTATGHHHHHPTQYTQLHTWT